jgi:hypothetical protein
MGERQMSNPDKLEDIRKLAYFLDNCIPIPGTEIRFGFDPIFGLLPGVGDFLGAVIGAYIVLKATSLGVPANIILLMVGNILLESVIGIVFVFGDLFDAAWKANLKNLALIEEHMD